VAAARSRLASTALRMRSRPSRWISVELSSIAFEGSRLSPARDVSKGARYLPATFPRGNQSEWSVISYADVNSDEYNWNIQTAELNMMSAVLAVIKWKKLCGYYADNVGEFNSTYIVARNKINNGELST
jgi:hypothetical protein